MVIKSNTLDYLWLQDGENGQPGQPGESGKSLYTWVKYATDKNGSNMTDSPVGAVYIGIAYNKETDVESNNPGHYDWTKILGDNGQDGYTVILSNENISFSTDGSRKPLSDQSYTCNVTIMQGVKLINEFSIGTITSVSGITAVPSGNMITLSAKKDVAITSDSGSIIVPIAINGKTINRSISFSCAKAGSSGVGVSDTDVQYYLSTSSQGLSGGSWQTDAPKWENGKYIWSKTVTTYSNGHSTESDPVCLTGAKGQDGANGKQYYTWIKYADSPTTGMSDSPVGKTYIGLAYNKETENESITYSDYNWSLIKGTDGAPGGKGEDGKTYYTWIKYATSSTGDNMSDSPVGKTYIGLAYNKENKTESNVAGDYKWSLFQGPKGVDGTNGTEIVSIIEEYAINQDKINAPTSGWSETKPGWEPGKYIWTRSRITYKNPTKTEYVGTQCSTEWEAINDIKIGCKNIFLKSATSFNKATPGLVNATLLEDAVQDDTVPSKTHSSFKVTQNSATGSGIYYTYDKTIKSLDKLSRGAPYIISFWAKGNRDGKLSIGSLAESQTIVAHTQSDNLIDNGTFKITTAWEKYYVVFTWTNYAQFTTCFYLMNAKAGDVLYLSSFMLEEGNKASSWQPAPEDFDDEIKKVVDSIGGVKSIVDNVNKKITDKVWQTDFEVSGINLLPFSEKIDLNQNTYKGSTAVKSDVYVIDGLNSYTLNTSQYILLNLPKLHSGYIYTLQFKYMRPYAPANLTVLIEGNQSSLTSTQDNTWRTFTYTFTAKNEENVQVKIYSQTSGGPWNFYLKEFMIENSSTASPWVDNNTSISSKYTEIVQDINGIRQTASSAYTTATSMNSRITTLETTSDGFSVTVKETKDKVDSFNVGGSNLFSKSQTFKDTWTTANNVSVNTSGVATLSTGTVSNAQPASIVQIPTNGYWEWEPETEYTISFVAVASVSNMELRIKYNNSDDVSKIISVGTKKKRYHVTIKTPASINAAAPCGFYATARSDNANIKISLPKLEVGNVATDYSVAQGDIEGKVTSFGSLVESHESYINANKSKIEMAVNSTYVGNQIDAIQIGGRNLLLGTDKPSTTSADLIKINGQTVNSAYSSYTDITDSRYHGYKLLINQAGKAYPYYRMGSNATTGSSMNGLVAGQSYTFSCEVKYKLCSATKVNTSLGFYIYTNTKETPGAFSILKNVNLTSTGGVEVGYWSSLKCTFTIPTEATMLYIIIRPANTTASNYAVGDYFELKDMMLEKSKNASGYSPAPEDIDVRFSNAELKITDSAIVSVVKANYGASDIASTINQTAEAITINSGKINLVGYTTFTNLSTSGQSTINGGNIMANTISADALLVGSGGNLMTMYDSFEQCTDENSGCFYKASGINVKINTSVAYHGNRSFEIENVSSTNGYAYIGDPDKKYGFVPIQVGNTYCVSAWVKSTKSNTSVFLGIARHQLISNSANGIIISGFTVGTKWTRIKKYYTVASTDNYNFISVGFNNNTPGTSLYVDAIQVEEVTSEKQSPAPFAPGSVTTIDGGNITTNSITADKIKVIDLNALNATIGGFTITDKRIYAESKNFLPFGEIIDLNQNTYKGSTAVKSDTYVLNGLNSYTLSTSQYILVNLPKLNVGYTYTFQFKYMRPYSPINMIVDIDGTGKTVSTIQDNTWRTFTYSFTAKASDSVKVKIYSNTSGGPYNVYFKEFMIENSSSTSSWTKNEEVIVIGKHVSGNTHPLAIGTHDPSKKNLNDCPFRVTWKGSLYAMNANFEGDVFYKKPNYLTFGDDETDDSDKETKYRVISRAGSISNFGVYIGLSGETDNKTNYGRFFFSDTGTDIIAEGALYVDEHLYFKSISGASNVQPIATNSDVTRQVSAISVSSNNNTDLSIYAKYNKNSFSARYIRTYKDEDSIPSTTSDMRLKNNIKLSEVNALDFVDKINLYSFDWKRNGRHQDIGFMAQELKEIDPMTVRDSDMLEINDFYMLGYAFKAIKELSQESSSIKRDINNIKQDLINIPSVMTRTQLQIDQLFDRLSRIEKRLGM